MSRALQISRTPWAGALLWTAAAAGLLAPPAAGQDRDTVPGVTLGVVYETGFQPALAVPAFAGRFGGARVAPQVEAIIGRDLRYSDRFTVLDSLPETLSGATVDYQLWDRLGAVWLVTGQVEGAGSGYVLLLELHDVLYGSVKERGRFELPPATDPGFRMAVHRASDAVVEWVTGEPGMAASRIAFTMTDANGNKDIYAIDSDGENLRRVTSYNSITLSPAWSPEGRRIVFTSYKSGLPLIYQLDLVTGEEIAVPEVREGSHVTPAYHPDGRTLAFSVTGGTRSGIYTWDVARRCCLANLTSGRFYDLSPTYSPDGRRVAFNTNRFGDGTPQIMIMPAELGGGAEALSPLRYGSGGYYTSPDWSPTGDRVAFHGRIRRGQYHIIVADTEARGRVLRQLTHEGNNEDPSWAPDGRHVAFVGERSWGFGLFVVDVATGRLRTLVEGRRVGVPDWSGSLRGND